jgi:hypothetical protein
MMIRFLLATTFLALSMHQACAGNSSFIDNMPELAPDPDRAGAMMWQKPGLDRTAYTRLMVEPLTIFISPDSEYQGLDADELKALADTFREVVTKTLEPEIPVVSERGEGVLYLRAAITNVKVAKKKRGLLGYTPIGLVVGAVKTAAAGPSVSLRDAVLEIDMLDSTTGERLGVLVDSAPKGAASELSWDAIAKTMGYYVERFKARMQAAK